MLFGYVFIVVIFIGLLILAFGPFVLSSRISEEDRKKGLDS